MMKIVLSLLMASLFLGGPAHGQSFLSVGAEEQFGTLDGVAYQSCAVSPFLDEQRIYLCFRERADGDLVVGERVLGSDEPVEEAFPERVVSRVVLALEGHFERDKTLYYEFPKEVYRDLTFPHLGPIFSGPRTTLAIVLQAGSLTVYLSGGDGAGSYRVNWHINVKELRVRRLDSVAEEGDEVSREGPWLELKEISAPKVVPQGRK